MHVTVDVTHVAGQWRTCDVRYVYRHLIVDVTHVAGQWRLTSCMYTTTSILRLDPRSSYDSWTRHAFANTHKTKPCETIASYRGNSRIFFGFGASSFDHNLKNIKFIFSCKIMNVKNRLFSRLGHVEKECIQIWSPFKNFLLAPPMTYTHMCIHRTLVRGSKAVQFCCHFASLDPQLLTKLRTYGAASHDESRFMMEREKPHCAHISAAQQYIF